MKEFKIGNEIKVKKAKCGDVILHGDVILIKEKLPLDFETFTEVKDSCVAYGEATGHAHKIFSSEPNAFILRECPKTQVKYLRIVEGCGTVTIRHQEHNPISLPAGDYKIDIQREYDPWSKRSQAVVD